MATPESKHLSRKIAKCNAKFSCDLRYISVLFLEWTDTGKLENI